MRKGVLHQEYMDYINASMALSKYQKWYLTIKVKTSYIQKPKMPMLKSEITKKRMAADQKHLWFGI